VQLPPLVEHDGPLQMFVTLFALDVDMYFLMYGKYLQPPIDHEPGLYQYLPMYAYLDIIRVKFGYCITLLPKPLIPSESDEYVLHAA